VTRSSNAPYEPQDARITGQWARLLALFLRFCEHVTIDSKDEGPVRLYLRPSQRYFIEEVFAGFALGIHDFVVVKGRQLGISTVLWAFELFWLTRFSLQAMHVVDDEPNKEIQRDIVQAMYLSLPRHLSRGTPRVANRLELAWNNTKNPKTGKVWRASRLMWAFANRQKTGQLGRSRGANFILADELDSWGDKDAPASLDAARSSTHPYRAYFWVGTGQGYTLLYSLWEQAQDSTSSKAIFVGWWRDPERVVTREERAKWAVYGQPAPTQEETEWGDEVYRRYDVRVSRQQLAWWRWTLAEGKGINGDAAKMMQEHPWFPEQSFQASGSEFLSPQTCLHVRRRLIQAPPAMHYRYDWGPYFDSKADPLEVIAGDRPRSGEPERRPELATLTMWEPPQRDHVYVLAGDPAYGSGPEADRFAATVWRCHPDAMVQAAEYATPLGAMYQYAWVLAHLAGAYKIDSDDHLILEIGGPGRAVHEELERMASYAFGLTPASVRALTPDERMRAPLCAEPSGCRERASVVDRLREIPLCHRHAALLRKSADDITAVLSGIQHFLYRRIDSITGQQAWHFNTTTENRIQIFEQLRDTVERGALVVRSPMLAEELAALRREDSGRIEAGGIAKDDLAFTSALAVHCWLQNVVPEIEDRIAPLVTPRDAPAHPGEAMLRSFVRGLDREPSTATGPAPYGMPRIGPGRGRR